MAKAKATKRTGANHTGRQLEKFIKDRLVEEGYTFVTKDKFKAATYLDQPIYTQQLYICQGIYDTKINCDFILFHPEKHPNCLIIEAKWQQSTGTTYEKFPYFVLNIQQRYPHKTVILLDGGGYTKKSEVWLRSQEGNNILKVLTMAEFTKWANNNNI